MTFEEALTAMKSGAALARAGWNGARMWVALTEGSTIKTDGSNRLTGAARLYAHLEGVNTITIGAHLDLRAADGSMVIGWKPSNLDLLTEDWFVVG